LNDITISVCRFPDAPGLRKTRVEILLRWDVPRERPEETDMLNNIGLPGLLLIAVVVLVLFGRGKISSLMGEVGKGITSFKKGVNEGQKELEETDLAETAKDVTPESTADSDSETDKDKV